MTHFVNMKRLWLGSASAVALAITGTAGADSLDDKFGPLNPPAYIKAYEADNHNKIAVNPLIQVGNKDNQLYLDEGEGYVWVIDKAGNFVIAPEITSPWGVVYKNGMMRIEDGKPKRVGYKEKYGHTALVAGAKARMSGELEMENGVWIINNKSGRYNKERPGRTKDILVNAAKYLEQIAPQTRGNLEIDYMKSYGQTPPAKKSDMKDIEWHYMLKNDYLWDGESKKLGKEFVAKTPYISWRPKVGIKEGFYLDTPDRYMKSKDEIFRVRMDKKVIKSKFTHKARSYDVADLAPLVDAEGEIDVSLKGDSYSVATDTLFNVFKFDFYNATVDEIFDYLMYADLDAYKQLTHLMRHGDRVKKTAMMRQSKYKGWVNTGPHKGLEVEIQIWKKILKPGKLTKGGEFGPPLLFEIGFDGKVKNRAKLDAAAKWLYNELKKSGLLAADQDASKTEITFANSPGFKASANPQPPKMRPTVSIKQLDGISTRNLDGSVNVMADGKTQSVLGKDGVMATVYQTSKDGKPLQAIALGANGKGNQKIKLVGKQGDVLVGVVQGSSLDTVAERAKLVKGLDGASPVAAYELLGDSAVDYLKPIIKKYFDPEKRSNKHYYWPGTED